MNLINVKGIGKREGKNWVLKEINFPLERFRKIAVTGESGSGKTTLLKIIGGLAQADAGEVTFEGETVKGPFERLIPGQPGIAYLSQHFELRNSYRVEEILEYANKLSAEAAAALYKVCRIDRLLKRRTDQLSGGEKQRIALARLLTGQPRLLLLDEPYSNLDLIHKRVLKSVINDIAEKLSVTCMLVSHDPLDVLSWADEVFIMRDGVIIQRGSPAEVYQRPVNEYAAGLLGGYNLLNAAQAANFFGLPERKGEWLFVRPEDFVMEGGGKDRLAPGAYPADAILGAGVLGVVDKLLFLGSVYELEVMVGDDRITVRTGKQDITAGDTVYITLSSRQHYITE